jgi:DNA-binding transcriptional LysR family regulator
MPAPSQYRQTFSIIGCSAARAVSKVDRLVAKVFSAPTDLRMRSARTEDPALRRVPAPRAMPPMTLWLLYHEDLRRSPRVRAAVAVIDEVIVASGAALVPAGFPFDPA